MWTREKVVKLVSWTKILFLLVGVAYYELCEISDVSVAVMECALLFAVLWWRRVGSKLDLSMSRQL